MAITIECRACDFFTDMEETSETNPTKCPQCGEQMFYAGTHRKYPEETFCSTLNFSTGKKQQVPARAARIGINCNYYETITLYIADNDIELSDVTDHDLDAAAEMMKDYHEANHMENWYFWMD